MTRPTQRQRLTADDRRTSILEAAKGEFADATYADVSVAQVAQAAGGSPGLVFHYFGSKAGLYEAVVRDTIDALMARQRAADEAMPAGSSARDHVRTSLHLYLDHVASHPRAWAAPFVGGQEPPGALRARREARETYVDTLRELVRPAAWARHDYALWGYFGFLDHACLRWVEAGCPEDDRHSLIEAALGALEGALGDWGR